MADVAVTLREVPIKKLFYSYLIPSILGLMLMSVNIVVDGIFIGHGVGPNGLAGVNIAVPVFSIFISVALWIGIGGATLYSMYLGKNEPDQAQSIFSQSFAITVMITSVIIGVCLWRMRELAFLLGANDVILPYVLDYMRVLLIFGLVFVLESLLSIFVRNDGNPKLAMTALIVAAGFNIIFNYVFIFIFKWGVAGAAYATVLATFLGFVVLLAHFLRRDKTLRFVKFRFQRDVLKRVLTIGFPSFVSEMAIAIVTLGYNIAFMRVTGEMGVASFSIVNYIHTMVLLAFIGVGSALQPIVSFHYGAKLYERMKDSLRLAVYTAVAFGLISVIAGWLFAGPMTAMFNVKEPQLYELTVSGIDLFFINYLFMGYNLVYVTYYQSIGQVTFSLVATFARGIVFVLIFLFILPPLFGANGIWLAVPAAEALTTLLIWVLNRKRSPIPGF